jgi:extracellular factor (EF) 3-hydroxypalmitic acid methyl ester biosynthesis protein
MGNDLDAALENFTRMISSPDQTNLERFKTTFFNQIEHISELIGRVENPEAKKEHFFRLCGLLDSSLMHGRTREKPLGYAGDFLLIDWIYTHKTAESGLGRWYDELFHSYEAAHAVRNRKQYFLRLCGDLAKRKRRDIHILDLGCGSCRDVIEAVGSLTNGVAFHFHCVDHEPQAIEYARSLLEGSDAESYVELECANVFHAQPSGSYDLIWSAGLFDYLDDRIAALLIRRHWRLLKEGGWFVFGNFSPRNPTRTGMELVGKWYLLHRSADQLLNLCSKAGVPFDMVEVEHEPLGINLFCKIQK